MRSGTRPGVIVFTCVLAFFFCTSAFAQQHQAGDVAFGYSILHDSEINQTMTAGWLVAANGNLNPYIGIVGEVGGNYKTTTILGSDLDIAVHSFMGGVRFRGETPRAIPFAQFLVGMVRGSAGFLGQSGSASDFAFQPGAGIDMRVTDRFAIRAQGDLRLINAEAKTTKEFRFAIGAAVGF